jgi:HTH-type transcriptional regulator / antitoxin HipB
LGLPTGVDAVQTVNRIGSIVRFHRRIAGLTQAELARMAGVGKASVFDVEKGKETVQLDTLLKIFSILNMKLDIKSPLMAQFPEPKDEHDGK